MPVTATTLIEPEGTGLGSWAEAFRARLPFINSKSRPSTTFAQFAGVNLHSRLRRKSGNWMLQSYDFFPSDEGLETVQGDLQMPAQISSSTVARCLVAAAKPSLASF